MTKYLPCHRCPNLNSYPILFPGIPADLLDCFWAIDYEKSQYSGKAVRQVAFFSGYKLRDCYRKVSFFDRSQVDQMKIIHTQDILSWHEFLANHERQRKQLIKEHASKHSMISLPYVPKLPS
jgi:hypothetical protein